MKGEQVERRGFRRVPLRWPSHLRRPGDGRTVEAETVNISGGGLYCIGSEPFDPGEQLDLVLVLPGVLIDGERPVTLHGRVTILRASPLEDGGRFGIACRMDDYKLAAVPGMDLGGVRSY